MIKVYPPTQWQIFIDQDSNINKFEELINDKLQFKSYDKMDDVVDGKLGVRYTFYPLTDLSTVEVENLIEKFLKVAE
jgi:hypothetical protein